MADTKIHDLTEETTPEPTTEIAAVKSPYGIGDDRRIKLSHSKPLDASTTEILMTYFKGYN